MRALLTLAIVLCAVVGRLEGAPSPQLHCHLPDCKCAAQQLKCSSVRLLDTSEAELLQTITDLDLSGIGLTALDHRVRRLHALQQISLAHNALSSLAPLHALPKLTSVNLRGNHLEHFRVGELPAHLRRLDVRDNHLRYLPKALSGLSSLRELNISGNPLECECFNRRQYMLLVDAGVVLDEPVTCHSHKGKLLKVRALHHCEEEEAGERMQGDEPQLEGSGDPDEDENGTMVDVFGTEPEKAQNDVSDEVLMPIEEEEDEDEEEEDVEGSGVEEEGSGNETLIVPTEETPLRACNFDCSTPLSIDDDLAATNTSEKDPSLFDEIRKTFSFDGWPFGSNDDEENTPAPNTTEVTEVSESPMVVVAVRQPESDKPTMVEEPAPTSHEEDKMHAAISNAAPGEMNTAGNPFGISDDLLNVIIIGGVIAVMLLFTLLLVQRRKQRRRRMRPPPSPIEQEMKPLRKPTMDNNGTTNGTNGTNNGAGVRPEKVPLMHVENGNGNGVEAPIAKKRHLDTEQSPPAAEDTQPQPQMRKKLPRDEEQLLPETHRVTVQAKELTRPKTPMLVNRTRSHDGQIITTPEAAPRY